MMVWKDVSCCLKSTHMFFVLATFSCRNESSDVQLLFLAIYFMFTLLLLNILSPLVISSVLCLYSYRTYMRPRYKVAYKVVTEMEWKCCYGYSGEDCNDGSAGGAGNQISSTRPQPRPGSGRGTHEGGVSHGSGQSGGHSGERILIHKHFAII